MESKRGRKGGAKKDERREDMCVYIYTFICVHMYILEIERERERERERENRGGRKR